MNNTSSVSEPTDEEPGDSPGVLTPSSYLALAMQSVIILDKKPEA
jgi:hypothetical protein